MSGRLTELRESAGSTVLREMAVETIVLTADALADPAPLVEGLVSMLRDRDLAVSRAAAEALGAMGARARGALPVLRELTQSEDSSLRMKVEEAIHRIDGVSPKGGGAVRRE